MMRVATVLFLICLTVAPSYGQTAIRLSLSDALREAGQHNTEVLAAQSDLEGARARLEQASLSPLQLQSGVNTAPDSPEGLGYLQTTTIGVEQQLGPFGSLGASRRVAVAGIESARAKLSVAQRDIQLRVVTAYYALAAATAATDLARTGASITQQLYDNALLRQRAGAVGSFEVLRANVELRRARSELVRAEGNARSARFALNALLGRPIETLTDVALPDETLAATSSNLADPIAHRDPQAAQFEAVIAEARARESFARSQRAPTLTLAAGTQNVRARTFGQTSTGALLNATLSVPLSDLGSIRGAVHEAQAAQTAARQLLAGRQLQFQAELAQTLSDIESAQSRLSAARDSQRQADEGVRIAQIGYRRGALSILDVLNARTADLTARADLNQSLSDLASAIARLHILRGDF